MRIKILFFSTALFLFAACTDPDPVEPELELKPLLSQAADQVILQTYQTLDERTNQLVNALQNLENTPSVANLASARQAWREARQPWEQSEGFLFGPVDQQGIDPAMDSWPVNEVDLENILNAGAVLTKDYLDAQDGTVKGFHTIEYLLFGLAGEKLISDFTQREFEYIRACAQSLQGQTNKLYMAWAANGQNFGKNLRDAGTTASIYPSQKAALQELVNGMVGIADEVANGKINDPFSQQNILLEESRFSANSKTDFADNIRSIRNIYLGSLNGSEAESLGKLTRELNPTLDTKVRAEIEAAILGIETIPGTFTTAIFEQGPAVELARARVRSLLDVLQGELGPFVQNL